MEALSKQFVDIVRTQLDAVGIPITNCKTTYNTFEYDDEPFTNMQLRIQVGDATDKYDKTEIAIDRIDGGDLKIALVSEMAHEGVLMRRVDRRYESVASPREDYTDELALGLVDEEIKRALPTIVTSVRNKTLDWMVPEPLHKYLSVNLDNTYGEYREDAHLDNESRIAESVVDSRDAMLHWNSIRASYEVCGYKDLGDDTAGRTITRMVFRTQTSTHGTKMEAECLHIDDDTVKTDTYSWSPYGRERAEKQLPTATADIALDEFRTTVQQKLEQRRTIADAIELPNEPQL